MSTARTNNIGGVNLYQPDGSIVNFYSVLGVSEAATSAEIQNAYRKNALQCHSDKTGSVDSEAKMIEINSAKDILLKEPQRTLYVAELSAYKLDLQPRQDLQKQMLASQFETQGKAIEIECNNKQKKLNEDYARESRNLSLWRETQIKAIEIEYNNKQKKVGEEYARANQNLSLQRQAAMEKLYPESSRASHDVSQASSSSAVHSSFNEEKYSSDANVGQGFAATKESSASVSSSDSSVLNHRKRGREEISVINWWAGTMQIDSRSFEAVIKGLNAMMTKSFSAPTFIEVFKSISANIQEPAGLFFNDAVNAKNNIQLQEEFWEAVIQWPIRDKAEKIPEFNACVRKLLEYGWSLSLGGKSVSPLSCAIVNGDVSLIKELIDKGASVDAILPIGNKRHTIRYLFTKPTSAGMLPIALQINHKALCLSREEIQRQIAPIIVPKCSTSKAFSGKAAERPRSSSFSVSSSSTTFFAPQPVAVSPLLSRDNMFGFGFGVQRQK